MPGKRGPLSGAGQIMEAGMPRLKKLLCAIDLSEPVKSVAEYARMIAQAGRVQVIVAYVVPAMTKYVWFGVKMTSADAVTEELVKGAGGAMDRFVTQEFPGLDARGIVAVGDTADELLRIADEEDVDLIVIGTHGYKAIDRFLFGSVAEKVARGTRCPVLTLNPAMEDETAHAE